MKLRIILFILFWLFFLFIMILVKLVSYQINNIDYYKLVKNPNICPFIKRILPNHTTKKYKFIVYKDKEDFKILDRETNKQIVITTTNSNVVDTNSLYIPKWSITIGESDRFSVPDLLNPPKKFKKTKFCVYISSLNIPSTNVYNQLKTRRPVDRFTNIHIKNNWFDDIVRLFQPYKFVIVDENDMEKLLGSLIAGCVPIYLGKDYPFNSSRIISIRDFRNQNYLIDNVIQIDLDKNLYYNYLKDPILSREILYKYTGWYYGYPDFYKKIYIQFPLIKRISYNSVNQNYNLRSDYPIKVMNMDQSKDRWKNIQSQFKKYPEFKYERFPAIYAKNFRDIDKIPISIDWISTRTLKGIVNSKNSYKGFLYGEIGIYITTMELFNVLTRDDKNEYYVVLEDDVHFRPNVKELFNRISDFPDDWDMVFLGHNKNVILCDCKKGDKDFLTKITNTCMPSNFSYVIRKRAAQFFLNFAFPMERPIDELYRFHSDNLNIYILNDEIVYQ